MSEKTSLIKGVRFEQESLSVYEQILLSVLVKNPCPFSAGIAVRFGQELVSVLVKNMQLTKSLLQTLISKHSWFSFTIFFNSLISRKIQLVNAATICE